MEAGDRMRRKGERPGRTKRTQGVQLNLWIKDPLVLDRFDRLVEKWSDEGQIPRRRGDAFVHMVGMVENPRTLQTLPLTSQERQTFSLLAETFRTAGLVRNTSDDLEVVRAMVNYLLRRLSNEANLKEFLRTWGGT